MFVMAEIASNPTDEPVAKRAAELYQGRMTMFRKMM